MFMTRLGVFSSAVPHLWVLLNLLAADSKQTNKKKKSRNTENELGPIRISRKPESVVSLVIAVLA